MSQTHESCDEELSQAQKIRYRPLALLHTKINWRHPVIGYLCALPVLALTLFLTIVIKQVVPYFFVYAAVLTLATSFLALFWGRGPTLLLFILGVILLDLLVIPPIGTLTLLLWPNIIQVIPLLLTGILISELTAQRQRRQQQLEHAVNTLRQYARELEALNTSLDATNRAKDQRFAIVAHELKTPLTTLRLYTQWLQRSNTPPQSKLTNSECLTTTSLRIEQQTQRLATLIDELLNNQSPSSPQNTFPPQPCDLVALCRYVVECQHLTTGRRITLTTPSPTLTVLGRPHHFEQVLNNLISNAVKYSPEKSPIEIDLQEKEDMAHISVHNAGPGIAPDQLPLLFIPGYRTSEASSSSIPGHGLGLAIVQTYVEQYHGRIWCESIQGEGTTFTVEFPLIQDG